MPCVPGTFQPHKQADICSRCPRGKFSETVRATECKLPDAGYVAGPSRAGQAPIATGWFAQCTGDDNNKVCDGTERCPGGTREENFVCIDCPAGYYSSIGDIRCVKCEEGQFAAISASPKCNDCDASKGLFSKVQGSIKCDSCKDGEISTGKICLEAPIDTNLPMVQNVHVTVAVAIVKEISMSETNMSLLNYSHAIIHWDTFKDDKKNSIVAELHVEWSNNLDFPVLETKSKRIPYSNEKIRSEPGKISVDMGSDIPNLLSKVLFVRLRTMLYNGRPGAWSAPNNKWMTTRNCKEKSYLDVSIFTNRSFDPMEWTCQACPPGSKCAGDITWDGVIARFGFWRIPGIPPNEFVACALPGACLGGSNARFEGKYLNSTGCPVCFDYSSTRLKEQCNGYYGFKKGATLCHKCKTGYRRKGLSRCMKCPKKGQNVWLLGFAVVLLATGLFAVVRMTIADAGKAEQSEIIRKITFNYLQVSALASGFPLHWPGPIEALFDFQGAISTAGEHLLNPDCTVAGLSPADLFYSKQIAYAFIPIGLTFIIFLIWRCYALVARVPWSDRVTEETHTIKDKMVVTICVLLYFFWPTSLKQAFRMFSCRW